MTPSKFSQCKSSSYVLGVKPENGKTASACRHKVALVQDGFKKKKPSFSGSGSTFWWQIAGRIITKEPTQVRTPVKMLWKFTRVNYPIAPPPKRLTPPPETTRVVSTTLVTLPDGQACSSLSESEMKNITESLCSQQMNFTASEGWPKNQTLCGGTARCLGARQNTGNDASEHTTDLGLTHTPEQNEDAENIANDLSQTLLNQTEFYESDFPPETQVTSLNSVVISPGEEIRNPSPSPPPTPSPSPPPSDINVVPADIFEFSPPPPGPPPTFVPAPVPIITPTPSPPPSPWQ